MLTWLIVYFVVCILGVILYGLWDLDGQFKKWDNEGNEGNDDAQ
jgi:hypothetical protein